MRNITCVFLYVNVNHVCTTDIFKLHICEFMHLIFPQRFGNKTGNQTRHICDQ